MTSVADSNQFDALATPTTNEQKSWEATGRGLKDDAKQQAADAKQQVKGKAAQLQEQVVSGAKQTVQAAKDKAAQLTGNKKLADASADELLAEGQDAAAEGWEEVKRRGNRAVKEGERALDEKLTPEQKAKLNKASRDVKQAGAKAQRKAEGLFASLLSAPQLRPVGRFIEKNNLQLPALVLGALLTLLVSLTLLRALTQATTPAEPEFDIHSLEASKAWAKHHAGNYKNQALDVKESLTARAAHFLANTPNVDSIRTQAVDWKDIGVRKLGLAEPTWSEWAMHYVTGRPITWQGRVESVLSLAKTGLKSHSARASEKLTGAKALLNDKLGLREPTLLEKAQSWITGKDASLAARAEAEARLQAASLSGRVGAAADSLKAGLADGVASIKAHIPGSADAKAAAEAAAHRSTLDKVTDNINGGIASLKAHIPGTAEAKAAAELAQAKLAAATHRSTLDKVASGAEYIKNRIVHGAEEAEHIAHDKANRLMDEAKLKAGL